MDTTKLIETLKMLDVNAAQVRLFRHAIAKTRGLTGWQFGVEVSKIMDELGHPHARYTLEQIRGNYRQGELTTRNFGIDCAHSMSSLIAENLFHPMNAAGSRFRT